MTPLQIVFLIVGVLTLVSAVMVVSARRMMHAALWLVLALLGVAVLFATLESGFFPMVQVVVYIGAIAILIVFGVMLTRHELQEEGPSVNRYAWLAGLAALLVLVAIVAALNTWSGFGTQRAEFAGEDIGALGLAFVSPDAFVIPFEVASVLLIGALIGAIYVAGEKSGLLQGADRPEERPNLIKIFDGKHGVHPAGKHGAAVRNEPAARTAPTRKERRK